VKRQLLGATSARSRSALNRPCWWGLTVVRSGIAQTRTHQATLLWDKADFVAWALGPTVFALPRNVEDGRAAVASAKGMQNRVRGIAWQRWRSRRSFQADPVLAHRRLWAASREPLCCRSASCCARATRSANSSAAASRYLANTVRRDVANAAWNSGFPGTPSEDTRCRRQTSSEPANGVGALDIGRTRC
jgi:hypothetical protein